MKLKGEIKGRSKLGGKLSVTRGPISWAYFYVALGFALAIEGTIIGMITPLKFPWNLVTFILLMLTTGWLFLGSGWFQNKLVGLRRKYEDKPR